MSILTLFCKIDDFFLLYTHWQTTHCLPETTTSENTPTTSATASERSDDDPYCLPSKQLSDVQTLLQQTCLCLLAC